MRVGNRRCSDEVNLSAGFVGMVASHPRQARVGGGLLVETMRLSSRRAHIAHAARRGASGSRTEPVEHREVPVDGGSAQAQRCKRVVIQLRGAVEEVVRRINCSYVQERGWGQVWA